MALVLPLMSYFPAGLFARVDDSSAQSLAGVRDKHSRTDASRPIC